MSEYKQKETSWLFVCLLFAGGEWKWKEGKETKVTALAHANQPKKEVVAR
jgi:hypothetical protein